MVNPKRSAAMRGNQNAAKNKSSVREPGAPRSLPVTPKSFSGAKPGTKYYNIEEHQGGDKYSSVTSRGVSNGPNRTLDTSVGRYDSMLKRETGYAGRGLKNPGRNVNTKVPVKVATRKK